MKKRNSYANLLQEEQAVQEEIDSLQDYLESKIKTALDPATLFNYWSEKAKEYLAPVNEGDRSIQDYLIDASLDYLVYTLTEKLLGDTEEKKVNLKQIVRTTIEKYYVKNSTSIKALVSDFISVQLEKIKR